MQKKWWHEAVVYQIYCKSFCDSNGDGIGDLQGVIQKLPELKKLGINAIWFTPIYPSMQVDSGYDVSVHRDIDPEYGTLDDFKALLDTAHSMGIRIILDMVINHTADNHEWFREAKKSKDNPYRNYYIWHDGKPDGSEPNNWGNFFNEFKACYGDLLNQLQKNYPRLTNTDIQVIALYILGLDNADICLLLGLTQRTIWSRRMRIKDRVGLGEKESLDKWIEKVKGEK